LCNNEFESRRVNNENASKNITEGPAMHFKVRQHNTKSNANCRRKKRKLLPATHLSPTTLTTTSTILRKEKKVV
jgi:hypothetical protein